MVPRGGGGRALVLAILAVVLLAAACSADPDSDAPPTTAGAPGSTEGTEVSGTAGTLVDGTTAGTAVTSTTARPTEPSMPKVDPASVEAFCALDAQLERLTTEQLAGADPADPEAFRVAFATFLTDNDAVVDQYVAAAPPEIEADVDATIGQALDAVDDPARFQEAMATSDASRRVSAFVAVNCA